MDRSRMEWDLVRAHIDAGRPWPIALVCANRDVWDQHQILVYGYEDTGPDQGKLFIHDNNNPASFGEDGHAELVLDFRGSAPLAVAPSGGGDLAGFFCSNYVADTPVGMSPQYGGFLSWTGESSIWMVTDGVRMPVAGVAELTALGGTTADVRPTGITFAPNVVRPRDGAVLRERNATTAFLYAGGAPFALTDATWVDRFGGVRRVRVVPDGTLGSFAGLPDQGTLLREWSDAKVWRIMGDARRWVRTPGELAKWGGPRSVRVVPDGALAPIPEGDPLPIEPVPEWHWSDLGRPPGVNVRRPMGAVTVRDGDGAPRRPHVFVEGDDFHLWCLWSSGAAWSWLDMGRPPGVNLAEPVGAVSVLDSATLAEAAQVFIAGSDGHIWCRWANGTLWSWSDLGRPSPVDVRLPMGATTAQDGPSKPERPHAFVNGGDGHVWVVWSG